MLEAYAEDPLDNKAYKSVSMEAQLYAEPMLEYIIRSQIMAYFGHVAIR